jgi:16S rRNA (uracil1498-N3)-methyltransferase
MPKYFVFAKDICDTIIINGDNAAHLIRSLRARVGDNVVVCDGEGTDYDCEIIKIYPGDNRLELIKRKTRLCDTEPGMQISLYQAIPKGDKMDLIIQKCVELGVTKIIPMVTDHTIAATKPFSQAKQARCEKIARAAAMQSMRGVIPVIEPVIQFREALAASAQLALTFAPYENEKKLSLKEFLRGRDLPASVGFFIGPEGGYAPREVEWFAEYGIAAVSLGNRILRTETAGFAVLTMLMYEFDKLGVNPVG